jgi:DNA polymerase I
LTKNAFSIHTENMENKKPLLLLIDGNALVHRAYHALPPLSVPKTGEVVGAVYGFAMMLVKAINDLKPSHAAVAFDRKAPTFRHQAYDQYKAQRPPMDEELVGQLGRVRQVVEAFNIPIFEMDGYEADDILGALSCQATKQNIETVIMTGDADIMQLVTPTVKVFYPRPGGTFSDAVLFDAEAVKTKYGVAPSQIADLKALKGDKSDNIPGVPGVGEVTAQKLVSQFGSIEGLLPRLDEVQPAKLQVKLKENLEQLKLSHHLATIDCNTPVSLDYNQCCRITRYDRAKAAELFRELNFNSLLSKLPAGGSETPVAKEVGSAAAAPTPDASVAATGGTVKRAATENTAAANPEASPLEIRYTTITTIPALEALIARLASVKEIALHTDGSHPTPMSATLSGIALSPAPGEAYYIPLNSNAALSADLVARRLQPVLENSAMAVNLHNAKYHMILLHKQGLSLNPAFDCMLAAYLLGDQALGLKELAFNRLSLEMQPAEAGGKTAAKQIALFEVNNEEIATAACAAADMTGRLSGRLKDELIKFALQDLYQKVELPLVPVLAEMEINGIRLDAAVLKEMSGRLGSLLSDLEKRIHQEAHEEFNINSPLQMGTILFDKMGIPGKKVHGKYTTDASVLEGLAEEHLIVKLILEYRQLMKLKSTYIDALPELINPQTGRVHSNFNQTRTTTGRLSSSDPNLQNIPVKTELGKEIRKAFVAPPGCLLIAGDYSQIDLRAMAHLSQDANLLEAFRQNKDIHSATAAQLFGVPISEVKPEMRRLAKTVNFGVIYGMSEFGLEQATELSRAEAGKFIKAYFEKYPGVTRYLEATREQARTLGYVQTLLGHRRYVPEVLSPNRQIREAAERMAINMPVQGTSSDIIKLAMIDLRREIQAQQIKSRLVLQVHDELIFEVPQAEVEIMTALIPAKMSGAIQLDVPLKVDIKSGTNWGAME